ncbi:8431_t:CDS:2 [Scutellospora calospora]|uniref:8431_t:CDS:1 n=1 Tax=Scutellospora calospora TaxID=85575 RepID=A0ACA9KRC8_9GLOM|nr:8431_t:CDS:2 [Scutellospora calospora]
MSTESKGHVSPTSSVEPSLVLSVLDAILLEICIIIKNIFLLIVYVIDEISKIIIGMIPSPYNLHVILMQEKYEPILKYLFVELSPVITVLYPVTYMLPYDVLTSFDDDLVITIVAPVILHIKKPEYHYQGIATSMISVFNSSYNTLYSHYYGLTEKDEEKIVESPMFKKMKYELEINQDFINSMGIPNMVLETLMERYQQNSIIKGAAVKINKDKSLLPQESITQYVKKAKLEYRHLIYGLIMYPLYMIIVFPLYIVCVIPMNFTLYSSLAISAVYLLGHQWIDECDMIEDPIERDRKKNYCKLRIVGLSAFFGIILYLASVVVFFMGFKAVYIAMTDSIESCIYFSFKMAVGNDMSDFAIDDIV